MSNGFWNGLSFATVVITAAALIRKGTGTSIFWAVICILLAIYWVRADWKRS